MARVLWYGDAGSHTGFARVTHAIASGLAAKGHEVNVFALNFPGNWMPELEGLRVWRGGDAIGGDTFGARKIASVIDKVEPDVTIALHDPALLNRMLFKNLADPGFRFLQSAPVIAYLPVDGYNYPDEITDRLPNFVNSVVMSRHGLSVFPGAQLVYHGVDPDAFWPVSERPIAYGGEVLKTKADCKRVLGFNPDKKLVLRVDKNSGRKDYAASILALGPLLEEDRDLQVHFHASTDPSQMGCDLAVVLTRFDLADDQVRLASLEGSMLGWGEDALNVLYNAADVFLSTSRGEGFGLTIAEALQCGVPVIAQNVSAIPEVVGPGGILLEPERLITVPAGQDLWLPDIKAFTEAIASLLYRSEDERRELGEAGRKHVSQFRWEPAIDRFHDFVEGFTRQRASTEALRGR